MQLFVLMVQWGSNVKVAQYIARRLYRLGTRSILQQVLLQAAQQVKAAVDPFVASYQHLKRRIQPHRRCA
jgi:hypothetical protein